MTQTPGLALKSILAVLLLIGSAAFDTRRTTSGLTANHPVAAADAPSEPTAAFGNAKIAAERLVLGRKADLVRCRERTAAYPNRGPKADCQDCPTKRTRTKVRPGRQIKAWRSTRNLKPCGRNLWETRSVRALRGAGRGRLCRFRAALSSLSWPDARWRTCARAGRRSGFAPTRVPLYRKADSPKHSRKLRV